MWGNATLTTVESMNATRDPRIAEARVSRFCATVTPASLLLAKSQSDALRSCYLALPKVYYLKETRDNSPPHPPRRHRGVPHDGRHPARGRGRRGPRRPGPPA